MRYVRATSTRLLEHALDGLGLDDVSEFVLVQLRIASRHRPRFLCKPMRHGLVRPVVLWDSSTATPAKDDPRSALGAPRAIRLQELRARFPNGLGHRYARPRNTKCFQRAARPAQAHPTRLAHIRRPANHVCARRLPKLSASCGELLLTNH